MQGLELKVPPLALLLFAGGCMWVVAWAAPAFAFAFPARFVSAMGVVVIGIAIAGMGVFSFNRAKTTVNPMKPESSSALVVSGIYRLTRNPMYLGILLYAARLGHIPLERAGFPDSSWIRPVYESFPNRTRGKGAHPYIWTRVCDLCNQARRWI